MLKDMYVFMENTIVQGIVDSNRQREMISEDLQWVK